MTHDTTYRTGRRLLVLAATVASIAIGLSTCGSNDSGGGGSAANAQKSDSIKMVYIGQYPGIAPLQMGIDRGVFKKQGIDLKLEPTTTPQTIGPRLASGDIDASMFSWGVLAVSQAAKLPITAISSLDTGARTGEPDPFQLIALRNSGPRSVTELAGKTVATNTLGSTTQLEVQKVAEAAGVNPKKIKIVPIPYPNQLAALRAKRIDAVMTSEPWQTTIKQEVPIRVLANGGLAVMSELPNSNVVVSNKLLKGKPDVARRFQTGLVESLDYARTHEDEVRKALVGFSGISPAVAEKMVVPTPTAKIDVAAAQRLADQLFAAGLLEKKADIAAVTAKQPLGGK